VKVPGDVVAALGGKSRVPVQATFNGVPYRGSIFTAGGTSMLGVTKAIIAEAGVAPGEVLDVVVENDEAPRSVEVPPELATALKKDKVAAAAWDQLSYSHQREHAGHIQEAKKEETRARRVALTIKALKEGTGGTRSRT
jgi:bacteriocin resistance YdeI/OmpD-like protein/uncharacterized protein DUF1905